MKYRKKEEKMIEVEYENSEVLDCTKEIEEYIKKVLPE